MVVPQGSITRPCIMTHTPLKSFTINSILPETALDVRENTSEAEDELCIKQETLSDADVSDCESDLDVTGTTPPLDCSNKSADEEESQKDGKFGYDSYFCFHTYQQGLSTILIKQNRTVISGIESH